MGDGAPVIPLFDAARQYRECEAEIRGAVQRVLSSGHYILGPEVNDFETEVARFLGCEHAVGVANGTDALVIALRALGVTPGDEVLVPANSFFATAEAVLAVDAIPVFVDVDPRTFCMSATHAAQLVSSRTVAMIPVHLYGHPADLDALSRVAPDRDLAIIEDTAQAFGARLGQRRVASIGSAGTLSFFPSKSLGGFGDGGMVVTNSSEVAAQARVLRSHGWERKHHPIVVGMNSRLDPIQAAGLGVKLPFVDSWNQKRREIAAYYSAELAPQGVETPFVAPNVEHVFHLYVVRVPDRDGVKERLDRAGIESAVYFPVPLHLTEACAHLGGAVGDAPEAERASAETLAIPLFAEMTDDEIERVAAAVIDAVASRSTKSA